MPKFFSKKLFIFVAALYAISFFLLAPAAQAYNVEVPIIDGKTTYELTEGMAIGEYIGDIYKFAIGAVGIIAAVVMMYGGVLWIAAGGNQTQITEAKAWIGAALTGLFLFMTSYLILNLINPNLTKFQPIKPEPVTALPDSSASGGNNTLSRKLSAEHAESQLNDAGIKFDKCDPANPADVCANLEGIQQKTINEIATLKTESQCGSSFPYITSGTEGGHASGEYSHSNGYKVDLSLKSSCLNNYIENTPSKFNYAGLRDNKDKMYFNISSGACYVKESSSKGDHWDVKAAGNGCP